MLVFTVCAYCAVGRPMKASKKLPIGQIIEAFQYGFDSEPEAMPDDTSVPVYKRLFRGPNTWPDEEALPGFRPAVEDLNKVYHKLTHELGHLICECLDEDPKEFDEYFDFEDPDLAASLNHNFSINAIPEEMRPKVAEEFGKLKSPFTGAHIDGPPFVALLCNDKPGLQVVADGGKWVNAPVTCRTAEGEYDVPVIPGSVIVNSGGTLMHLSKGRIGATLHRVNTLMIPEGETRVSLPYFLLPKMEGPLVPFGEKEATTNGVEDTETGYKADRDRGTNAAVNRMGTFPSCTRLWWKDEYKQLQAQHRAEVVSETESAFDLAKNRAKEKQAKVEVEAGAAAGATSKL